MPEKIEHAIVAGDLIEKLAKANGNAAAVANEVVSQ